MHWCCDTHKAAFCSSSAFQLLHSLHPSSLFSELGRGGGMNVLLRAEWSTITNAQYLSGHKSLHLLHFTAEFLWLRLRESNICGHNHKFLEAVAALSDEVNNVNELPASVRLLFSTMVFFTQICSMRCGLFSCRINLRTNPGAPGCPIIVMPLPYQWTQWWVMRFVVSSAE